MGASKNVEPHSKNLSNYLNGLRAAVLGANDGIISIAGLVVGVAGAASNLSMVLISGVAGVVAGALSMAGGEYVSVSTQRDTEKAAIEKENWELEHQWDSELEELADIYKQKGLSTKLASEVAFELMKNNALAAHAEVELNIDPENYTNPWTAAFFSMVSFTAGAILPLLTMLLLPLPIRVVGTFLAVLVALALTGYISAKLGGANSGRAALRNVVVGASTMTITYGIGMLIKI
ncbi:MAG: VIT1/CCC1 transporter family protein [Saezia sp.]